MAHSIHRLYINDLQNNGSPNTRQVVHIILNQNGLAEAAVKSVKLLIKKCNRSKQGLLEGLLILRNTSSASGVSPAQLLKGVKLQDNLPTINYGVDHVKIY